MNPHFHALLLEKMIGLAPPEFLAVFHSRREGIDSIVTEIPSFPIGTH